MTHPLQSILDGLQIEGPKPKTQEDDRQELGCVECDFNEWGTFHCFEIGGQRFRGDPRKVLGDTFPSNELPQVFSRDCECKKKKQTSQRLELPDVPPRHRHCCFQGFSRSSKYQRDAYNLARGYLMRKEYEQARGVVLWGSEGKGKTHLAISLMRELLQLEYRGKFIASQGTFHYLKNNIESSSRNLDREGETQLSSLCYGQQVIVLDDMAFQGKMSSWEAKETAGLIDYCYQYEIRLIITMNVKWPEGLDALLGSQIRDRLTEMCIPIYCGGVSQRVEAAKEYKAQELTKAKSDDLPF